MLQDDFDYKEGYRQHWLPDRDPYCTKLLDWFVLNGFNTFEENDDGLTQWVASDHPSRPTLIGVPLCDGWDHPVVYFDEQYSYELDHIVEVATLAAYHTALPLNLVEHLVLPIQQRLEIMHGDCSREVHPFEGDDIRSVWVTRRFTAEDFDIDVFDSIMREHFALVNEVEEAIF
jgi:hypothetical protein